MSDDRRRRDVPGPRCLWLVRHGQSAGNLARDAAEAARERRFELGARDMDVPLSPLGERQAEALGRWLVGSARGAMPDLVVSSPYRRAVATAEAAMRTSGVAAELIVDERLREREMGLLEGLTRYGIEHHHPEQAALMTHVGKFYHRPPCGESWCDVILRLRGFIDSLCRDHADRRVLVVCHGVVVMCFRYLIERLDERALMAVDALHAIANCSVTRYEHVAGSSCTAALELREFNLTAPLDQAGETVTRRADVPAAT